MEKDFVEIATESDSLESRKVNDFKEIGYAPEELNITPS